MHGLYFLQGHRIKDFNLELQINPIPKEKCEEFRKALEEVIVIRYGDPKQRTLFDEIKLIAGKLWSHIATDRWAEEPTGGGGGIRG